MKHDDPLRCNSLHDSSIAEAIDKIMTVSEESDPAHCLRREYIMALSSGAPIDLYQDTSKEECNQQTSSKMSKDNIIKAGKTTHRNVWMVRPVSTVRVRKSNDTCDISDGAVSDHISDGEPCARFIIDRPPDAPSFYNVQFDNFVNEPIDEQETHQEEPNQNICCAEEKTTRDTATQQEQRNITDDSEWSDCDPDIGELPEQVGLIDLKCDKSLRQNIAGIIDEPTNIVETFTLDDVYNYDEYINGKTLKPKTPFS
eukprot:Tbor_TRINITY_DN5442_c1_g12::TRINITY_DN5442_c1_g12_i1::g.25135::m.25135